MWRRKKGRVYLGEWCGSLEECECRSVNLRQDISENAYDQDMHLSDDRSRSWGNLFILHFMWMVNNFIFNLKIVSVKYAYAGHSKAKIVNWLLQLYLLWENTKIQQFALFSIGRQGDGKVMIRVSKYGDH